MRSSQKRSNEESLFVTPNPDEFCPFLGTRDDPETLFQYASEWNHCHRPGTPNSIDLGHQARYCLTKQHVNCPVYKGAGGPFPSELAGSAGEEKKSTFSIARMTGGVLILLSLAGLFWLGARAMSALGAGGADGTPTLDPAVALLTPSQGVGSESTATATATRTLEPSATLEPSFTPTSTETPLPTSTPFPTGGPNLETPFGPDGMFLIHVVKAGESFTSISNNYGTTVQVLQVINVTVQGALLWEGRQIVVALGVEDPAGLPQFEVVYTTASTTVEALADEYDSDPEQIRFYNQLGPGPQIPSGRWLIIPVEG